MKQYLCPSTDCGARFSRGSSLWAHLWNQHKREYMSWVMPHVYSAYLWETRKRDDDDDYYDDY